MALSTKFTFNQFEDFITKAFEELYTYEKLFRNQIIVETYIDPIVQNKEKLQKIFLEVTALQCNQQFLDNGLCYLDMKLQEMNRVIDCFENNFKGPEYFTCRDVARTDLYNFLLCVCTKLANIGEGIDQMNSEMKEVKRNVKNNPIEKIGQLMMKHLSLLESIETRILWLREEVQRALFLEMVVMKGYNLKLKPC